MIRIWLIAGIALLAGCESEFERCMSTELPIANEAVGMEDELAASAALETLGEYLEFIRMSEPLLVKWYEQNPQPERGESESSMEVLKEWYRLEEAEIWRHAQTFNLPVSTFSEYQELEGNYMQLLMTYVEPRSPTASCLTDECLAMPYEENLAIQMREAAEANETALSQLRADARRLAGRTCNSNGIYE